MASSSATVPPPAARHVHACRRVLSLVVAALLITACEFPPRVEEPLRRHMVWREHDGDRYTVVHDKLRQALLHRLSQGVTRLCQARNSSVLRSQ